MVMITVKSQYY